MTTNYRGVSCHHQFGRAERWVAAITVRGRRVYIGSYPTDVEAARAYDRVAKKLLGEKAILNFPVIA